MSGGGGGMPPRTFAIKFSLPPPPPPSKKSSIELKKESLGNAIGRTYASQQWYDYQLIYRSESTLLLFKHPYLPT